MGTRRPSEVRGGDCRRVHAWKGDRRSRIPVSASSTFSVQRSSYRHTRQAGRLRLHNLSVFFDSELEPFAHSKPASCLYHTCRHAFPVPALGLASSVSSSPLPSLYAL